MDSKMAAYMAKQIAAFIMREKSVNPALKETLGALLGADMATLKHEKVTTTTALALIDQFEESGLYVNVDYITVVDAKGAMRHLIFV